MNIRSKKGYILILLSVIIAAILASVMALQTSSILFNKENWQETENIKGYYACVSGLRYAAMLLRNPEGLDFGTDDNYSVTGNELGGNFFGDLDLGPMTMTVIINDEVTDATSPDYGKYKVDATCTY